MDKLDIKLNLLQTKFYFLLGQLVAKAKKLPAEEGLEILTIVEMMNEELNKFLNSFKEKGGEK